MYRQDQNSLKLMSISDVSNSYLDHGSESDSKFKIINEK